MSVPMLLIYDIPDSATIPNPTVWLLSIAVRINKSVWIINESQLPYRELEGLERAGATWYSLPFDTRAMGDITELLVRSLSSDIRKAVVSANISAEKIARKCLNSKKPLNERTKEHKQKTNPVVKKLGQRLQSMRRAARIFQIDPEAIGYSTAARGLTGLRQAILQKGELLRSAARSIEKLKPNDPLARAVRKGECPAWALADYLNDNENSDNDFEAQAECIRTTFTW